MQKLVLNIIKKNFLDTIIKRLYKTYNEGFYVNTEIDLTNIKQSTKYIDRYLARPAIAEYRISSYDGKSVTSCIKIRKLKRSN